MGILANLVRAFRASHGGRRTWTPAEVRELIAAKSWARAREAAEHLSPQLKHRAVEQQCLLGEVAFQERRDDEAAEHFRAALKEVPGLPSAHYGLSLILSAQGDFDAAARHAQFAVRSEPLNGRYLAQLGYAHVCLGNFQMAENPIRRASLAMPDNAYVWNNLGIVLRAKGDFEEAARCFERAVKDAPDFEMASENLAAIRVEMEATPKKVSAAVDDAYALKPAVGKLEDDPDLAEVLQLERNGELQRAIAECEAMLLRMPDDERPVVLLSRLYESAGDIESAIDALTAYLSRDADARVATGALGLVYLRAEQPKRAEPLLRRALESDPEHLDYVCGLARTLSGQERFAEAAEYFERALALAPDNVALLGQLAGNLANQCRYQDAMAVIDELKAKGLYVGCAATTLSALGRFDEALEAADRDVRNSPSDPAMRFQRASLRLLKEDYGPGWDDYAFRGLSSQHFRTLPFPLWRGEPLEGKRIIVLAEQGLGDQIMFASCLPDLVAMNPTRVVVEMIARVAKTVRRSFPGCDVVATNQGDALDWVKEYPDTDYFIPLGDLPRLFRRERVSFPHHDGYLKADPLRVAHWRQRLESSGRPPFVGVSWRGGSELTRRPIRSMEPEQLVPMALGVDATWVCLQYGKVQAEVDRMAATAMPMLYWPASIDDLDEFAALISALDLVVTVCNTTVHYAGALGKPVWVMAPKVPEWRYGLSSTSMPWYPSSRMFRQAAAGDWDSILGSIHGELVAHFNAAARDGAVVQDDEQ